MYIFFQTKHGVCSSRNPIVESDIDEGETVFKNRKHQNSARDVIQILVDYKDKKGDKRGQLFKGSRPASSGPEETSKFLLKEFTKNPAYHPHAYKKKNVVRRLRLSKWVFFN